MRTDPSDTGGLFITRRPGTRPPKYKELPETAGEKRRRADGVFAGFLLFVMVLVNLCFWGRCRCCACSSAAACST